MGRGITTATPASFYSDVTVERNTDGDKKCERQIALLKHQPFCSFRVAMLDIITDSYLHNYYCLRRKS
eukprot:scaffold43086_cov53-Cyclotella_meneghiniana.AAC.9